MLGANVITRYIPSFEVFGIFKMNRVFRLGGIIARFNIPEHYKAMLNLFKLTFYLFLWFHATACGWYIIC